MQPSGCMPQPAGVPQSAAVAPDRHHQDHADDPAQDSPQGLRHMPAASKQVSSNPQSSPSGGTFATDPLRESVRMIQQDDSAGAATTSRDSFSADAAGHVQSSPNPAGQSDAWHDRRTFPLSGRPCAPASIESASSLEASSLAFAADAQPASLSTALAISQSRSSPLSGGENRRYGLAAATELPNGRKAPEPWESSSTIPAHLLTNTLPMWPRLSTGLSTPDLPLPQPTPQAACPAPSFGSGRSHSSKFASQAVAGMDKGMGCPKAERLIGQIDSTPFQNSLMQPSTPSGQGEIAATSGRLPVRQPTHPLADSSKGPPDAEFLAAWYNFHYGGHARFPSPSPQGPAARTYQETG